MLYIVSPYYNYKTSLRVVAVLLHIDFEYKVIEWKLTTPTFNLLQLVGETNYYPASLFSQNVTSAATLASGSNKVCFYGEIYSDNSQTTYDMGTVIFSAVQDMETDYYDAVIGLISEQ
ncbi:hypothetical protein A9K55_001309 [Cordyceps militaris]|uniref:Uncharacterized protein n=1 Tax=Cordyceps militaris TaxID=73501 RepID=A0A2H4SR97_CORMI|nr:hypothetical protein A9K55_001309 [Cordyceps militaris]